MELKVEVDEKQYSDAINKRIRYLEQEVSKAESKVSRLQREKVKNQTMVKQALNTYKSMQMFVQDLALELDVDQDWA